MATGSGDVSAVYEILYNPNYFPSRSPKAHIERLSIDGEPTFILMKQSAGEYYEVDTTTQAIWNQLDGNKTVKEVYEEVKSVDAKLTERDVRDVMVSLAEEGILESTEQEQKKGRVELQSAFQLNVQLVKDVSKTFTSFFRVTRFLTRKWELPVALGITTVGFALFFTSFVRIFNNPSTLNIAGSALLGFFFYQLVVLLPVYAVHELAHAAMCDYYGGKPGEIGTGLYYLAPFFYCDTSDAWRLSRRARIMISVAGPLSTVVISAIFVFWSYLVTGYAKDVLQISAFFGFYGSLTNFSPVIETDGYYILSDVLNIPNLRDEAFSYMKRGFLTVIRRPVKAVHRSPKEKRIVAVYTAFTVAWLAFFGYTTAWLMGVYGASAYTALSSLVLTVLRYQVFDLTTVGVNVATLAYFGLIVAGFAVMGFVSYRNLRMKGVKLETIHNKRASIFLPLPSDTARSKASDLVEGSRKLAREFSHFSSVTLQPPFCVAVLKLGKVDQSLEDMWDQMRKVEEEFRAMHRRFLGGVLAGRKSASRALRAFLLEVAGNFPSAEKERARASASQLVRTQEARMEAVMQASFGTVWTLGLSPDDYKRIRKGMFPALLAEDLSVIDLPSDVEDFKLRRVVGLDAVSKLSTEIESESKEAYKRPDIYQTTVFLEPVKSRLVFIGRTDRVEGSVAWLGGLYLYQAWTSYLGDLLEEGALGLKSIRLSHPVTLSRTLVSRFRDAELQSLRRILGGASTIGAAVSEALGKIESTFESASNFHEMLGSLVSDESVDVALYRPIVAANEAHLTGLKERIEEFRSEFGWVSKRLASSHDSVRDEIERRASESPSGGSLAKRTSAYFAALWGGEGNRGRNQAHDSEVKLLFATTRLAYEVVVGSDLIA